MASNSVSNDTEFEFVHEVPEKYTCNICAGLLRDPQLTECCGQHFCQICLHSWFKRTGDRTCPHCRKEDFVSIINKSIQREMHQLKVYCSHREEGCQWMGELGDLQTHLHSQKGCGYAEINCPNNKWSVWGMHKHKLKRKDLQRHLASQCHLREYKCEYCSYRDTYMKIMGRHYNECRRFPLPCPNKCAETRIQRRNITAHRQQCPLEPVQCPFQEAGCEIRLVRRDLEKHLSGQVQQHLLLTSKATCTLKRTCTELEEENNKLKRRCFELERKVLNSRETQSMASLDMWGLR